ncbi:serine/threonine-protein kinase [Nocardia sp. NPDC003345]
MADTLRPGEIFAGYLIENVLGVGGMGTVYVARHPRLPRREALKVLSREFRGDPEFHARFLREAELAARLDHPNIVAVHDRGIADGLPWIAMQYVEGVDVAGLIRRNPAGLPVDGVLHIIGSVAWGLDAAHRAGMVHRDVKPANILLEHRPGRPDQVYISDFGIGRGADQTTLTAPGSVLGTLAYAAPEQITGYAVDHRADVYALGVTLYEMLTGSKPFRGPGLAELMRAHLEQPPPRPSAVVPGLPPAIDRVLAVAMAKNPADRFPSCGMLARAAAAAFGHETPGHRPELPPVAAPPTARRAVSRGRMPVLALGALIAALALAAVVAIRYLPAADDAGRAAPGTTTAATLSWGHYQYMVDALPGLLPDSPVGSGHQGIRCNPQSTQSQPVELGKAPGPVSVLYCTGDRNPLRVVDVMCKTDRSPAKIVPLAEGEDGVVVGAEEWVGASSRGRVVLIDLSEQQGELRIQFDDPYRDFCLVTVYGGTSGRDLYDRWWSLKPF